METTEIDEEPKTKKKIIYLSFFLNIRKDCYNSSVGRYAIEGTVCKCRNANSRNWSYSSRVFFTLNELKFAV